MPEISNYAFDQTPVRDKVGGFSAEVHPAQGVFTYQHKFLLIAQKTADGTGALSDGPQLIMGNGSRAIELCGRGSLGHIMAMEFKRQNPVTELWLIVQEDDPTGTAATGTLTFTGPATETRQGVVYIGLTRIAFSVQEGDDASTIAAACAAEIEADTNLPVTVSVTDAVVALTFRHKGLAGNDLPIHLADLAQRPDERLPVGVGLTFSGGGYLAGGSGNPDVAGVLAQIEPDHFDYVFSICSDDYNLDQQREDWKARWGPLRQQWGVGFTVMRGSPVELHTMGGFRNSPYMSSPGLLTGSPVPGYLRGIHYAACCAWSLSQNPARPLHGLQLAGEEEYGPAVRLPWADKQTLLTAGISLVEPHPATGQVQIANTITFYQTNAFGDPDDSWHDLQTPAIMAYICLRFRHYANTNWLQPRLLFANDDDRVDAPHITPKRAHAQLVTEYGAMVREGVVNDIPGFAERLRVGRSTEVPTRMNVLLEPDVGNPLLHVAMRFDFHLQYPATEL